MSFANVFSECPNELSPPPPMNAPLTLRIWCASLTLRTTKKKCPFRLSSLIVLFKCPPFPPYPKDCKSKCPAHKSECHSDCPPLNTRFATLRSCSCSSLRSSQDLTFREEGFIRFGHSSISAGRRLFGVRLSTFPFLALFRA